MDQMDKDLDQNVDEDRNQDSVNSSNQNHNHENNHNGNLDDDDDDVDQQLEIDEWEQVRDELRKAANETKQAMIAASNDSRLLGDPFKLQVLKKFLCPSIDGHGECLWQTEHGCLFQHVQPANSANHFVPFPDWICFGHLSEHCDKSEEDCLDGVHLTFEQLNDLDGYQKDHYETIENFRIKCLME